MIVFQPRRHGFSTPLGDYETVDEANAAAERFFPDGAKYTIDVRDLEDAEPEPEPCDVLADLERHRCRRIQWAGVAP